MDFLRDIILLGLAFVGVLVIVASLAAAALFSIQERFGHLFRDGSFDQAFSAADRLHAEAQRAIRDLEGLANRGER